MDTSQINWIGKVFGWVLTIFISLAAVNCLAGQVYSTSADVTFPGIVGTGKFADANDHMETAVLLTLERAIDVDADEYGGPASGVTVIQLVGVDDLYPYVGKCVRVNGHLFFPITAHHHTKALLEVSSIVTIPVSDCASIKRHAPASK